MGEGDGDALMAARFIDEMDGCSRIRRRKGRPNGIEIDITGLYLGHDDLAFRFIRTQKWIDVYINIYE